MSAPVATIRKNASEELRVDLTQFNGHDLVNLRVFYQARNGSMQPGRQGLALRAELQPELRDAIIEAEAEARRRKLIKGGT